ncbi:MAG: 2-hydroxy-3-oxopropionate reductase [Alphaproteobacteria bacterium]|nr:2-hydroxy-3-oxopropionate reductase [Alphaproteobacteria bacterium]
MEVGFIGLGIMGRPMAGHLAKAGHRPHVVRRAKAVPPELNAVVHETARAVAESAEVVILMLPDTPDVEAVLFGPDGVAEGLAEGKLVIDMSSISPTATQTFAERIEAQGSGYVDAPVSGGEAGAKAASLTIMAGGPQIHFDRARPLFEAMGRSITHIGPRNGDGQVAKVANQIVVALTIEAVAEALVFAAKAGADPRKVREALLGGFAGSKILDVHGLRMIERAFDPGFRVALHQKDLNIALQAARELKMALPNTAATQELFNVCRALGGANWDHSALVRVLETMAAHEVG